MALLEMVELAAEMLFSSLLEYFFAVCLSLLGYFSQQSEYIL